MSDAPQTLPQVPSGTAPDAAPQTIVVVAQPEAPTYTEAQLAEMKAIPSRPVISDGTKNVHYNPKMDPGSGSWDAHAYFAQQESVRVFVHKDPESPDTEIFGVSINGFELPCYPGFSQWMPVDFADLLKQRNSRIDVLESRLVSKDEDAEGAFSLSVSGAKPKPFVRLVAS